jgi:hypothetical protein
MVFRSADNSKQTDDLFVNVYGEGLVVDITQPQKVVLEKNTEITLSAQSSEEAELKLFLDNQLIAQTAGSAISENYTFAQSGNFLMVAQASTADTSVRDTMQLFVREDVISEPKPLAYQKGINYTSENSAALVLWAPLKSYVFVIGDFNNWQPSNDFLMKKDGDYYWLEIDDLEKGQEYIFQYWIDGEIKIADPYAEKIIDPWNDPYIPEGIYPDLIAYPAGKTEGIAAVLQTGQEEYNWQIEDFDIPDKNKLVIYELLIRDFTKEHSYQAVIDNLDYLEDLRVNVLELMPVNEFEGNSSWGYNPSFYFAPDKYYGPKNKLKELIDECHKRGIAVVIDMVLNHSYGQSPFALMYMDNWEILPENPWYNVESPNQVYKWGYDFNHERDVVKELVDSVNSFWMYEYKVDGFRFDFTKGFTQTPGDGWAYDAPRIDILIRMADEIWKRNSDALVILEHLADNREETELANYGMLLWGNVHGKYQEAARGNTAASDLSEALYSERGWDYANLVSYPESHDEERIMYTIKNTGLSSGEYNIRNQQTALDRIELNSLFHLLLPGPKMIWQFGERGYDLSINRCEDGTLKDDCRTSPKPPYWQYLNNSNRTDVFRVMAKLNELKQKYAEFAPDEFSYDLSGAGKWFISSTNNQHATAIGNFDIQSRDISITFPRAGKFYEFFSGDSIEISNASQTITMEPGEYRLYSTIQYEEPDISTNIIDIKQAESNIRVYPNPAVSELTITAQESISSISIYSGSGVLVHQSGRLYNQQYRFNVEGFKSGLYFVRVVVSGKVLTEKILVQ